MGFRALFGALCRRDLGRRPAAVLAGWLLLGAGAAIADARLPAGEPGGPFPFRLLADFPVRFATLLAFCAALLLIVRTAEDRAHGWLLGWCGSGGSRARYAITLYLSVVAAVTAAYIAAATGFSLTRQVLGTAADLARLPVRAFLGVLVIGAVGSYGLFFGLLIQRVFPAVLLAAVLFAAPLVAAAVVVVTQDLATVPESARWWVLHLPSPVPATTLRGVLRHATYIGLALAVGGWLAHHRVARIP